MTDTDSFEIIGVRPIWCRFDGKCWSDYKSGDYSAFCSEPANKVSEFYVDCAVVARFWFTSDNYFDIRMSNIIVKVKFYDFINDYEIVTEHRSHVKCDFAGGDKWRYENYTFHFDVFGYEELLKNISLDIETLNANTYIKDEIEYYLGYRDDGRLADEITKRIADVVADRLEIF